MKKPNITKNYEFEGYIPDGHFNIGDVLSHPQGSGTEFHGNEHDIKAISAVPDMIEGLIRIASNPIVWKNMGSLDRTFILNTLEKAGVIIHTEEQLEPITDLNPLPIENLYVRIRFSGSGIAGFFRSSAKDADALYMDIVEFGDEPEAPNGDGNGGMGMKFFGSNVHAIAKQELYDQYVIEFNKLS